MVLIPGVIAKNTNNSRLFGPARVVFWGKAVKAKRYNVGMDRDIVGRWVLNVGEAGVLRPGTRH